MAQPKSRSLSKGLPVNRDLLEALARVGTHVEDGRLRLYHATTSDGAKAILNERCLRPKQAEDIAERMLQPNQGSIFLSSSPTIEEDLAHGAVLLAVDINPNSVEAELIRDGYGDPPRVELRVDLSLDQTLPLLFVDRLDRQPTQADLSPEAQAAVNLFAESPVGQQLANIDEQNGRCGRASLRFLAALRQEGSDGTILTFSGDRWWHAIVLPNGTDLVLDWTPSQMEEPAARTKAPFPRIETRAQAEARWGLSAELDVDSDLGR